MDARCGEIELWENFHGAMVKDEGGGCKGGGEFEYTFVIPAEAGIPPSTCLTQVGTETIAVPIDRACFPRQSLGVCIPKQGLGNEKILSGLVQMTGYRQPCL